MPPIQSSSSSYGVGSSSAPAANAWVVPSFIPNVKPQGKDEFVAWATGLLDEADERYVRENDVPALMSYIWLPHDEPNAEWAADWMPEELSPDIEPWQAAVFWYLGANPNQLAERLSEDDNGEDAGGRKQVEKSMKKKKKAGSSKGKEAEKDKVKRRAQRIRKRIDDWRREHGGLGFPAKLQLTSLKNEVGVTKMVETIFTGLRDPETVAEKAKAVPDADGSLPKLFVREPLTALQLYFNTTWRIDAQRGLMMQPTGFAQADDDGNLRVRAYPLSLPERIPAKVQLALEKLKIPLPDERDLKRKYPHLFPDNSGDGDEE